MRGSVLAVTSPRVFEVATGEIIGFEELGGVDVHSRITGQIDVGVDTFEEGYDAVRKWLSYLPSNAWTNAPRSDYRASLEPDEALAGMVPSKRTLGYDMRRFSAALLDPGTFMELQPGYAESHHWVGALGRIRSWNHRQQPHVQRRSFGSRSMPESHQTDVFMRCL